MFTRKALCKGAQLTAARHQGCSKFAQRRGYAAAAAAAASSSASSASSATPSSFDYETSDVAGVKVASRDSHGPTTRLAVVAKAGTRYEPGPGLTTGLEEFAFKVCEYFTRLFAFSFIRLSWVLGIYHELIPCTSTRTLLGAPLY